MTVAETETHHQQEAALAAIYQKALAVVPGEHHDRLERGLHIVEADGVIPEGAGSWLVRNGTGSYRVQHVEHEWTCECPDSLYRSEAICKHRWAVQLWKRWRQTLQEAQPMPEASQEVAPMPEPVPTLPAALMGHVVTIQGKPYVRYAGLLALAHQGGLVALSAAFVSVTPDLAIAHATATFADGRVFTEAGDATPGNVPARVKPHFARMALTRAKSRCLRDALNIDLVALEELGE
jgi:hypothetical protein